MRAFDRSTICLTSHPRVYKGYWSESLNRWSVVDWIINIRQHLNQPLLLGTGDSDQNITEWGQKSGSAFSFSGLSPVPTGATL